MTLTGACASDHGDQQTPSEMRTDTFWVAHIYIYIYRERERERDV